MNKTVLDLWVGLFVIAGIAALLFLALKVGSTSAVSASNSYEVDRPLRQHRRPQAAGTGQERRGGGGQGGGYSV